MIGDDGLLPGRSISYRQDNAHAAPARPFSQGDVFLNIPLAGPQRPTQNTPTNGSQGQGRAEGHRDHRHAYVCSAEPKHSSAESSMALAPVVKCPKGFDPPWDGYYELFPLPNLREGADYVAKLNEVCPVPSDALVGRRIASLNEDGLEALFHRLAMNSIRFPEVPAHFGFEAKRLTCEIDLWEAWTDHRDTEDGFQAWLDETFGGQVPEDANGKVVEGSALPSGRSRREVLVWNFDEIRDELVATLA